MERVTLFVFCFGSVFVTENIALTRSGVCDTDWHYFKSSCYNWYPRNHTTFDEARNVCKKENGSLARVITNESYEFIKANVVKTDGVRFWSGLHRCHSSWYLWTDDTPLIFSKFGTGEPNNDNGNENCVEIYSDGQWNDQDCSQEREFICENLTCSRIKKNSEHHCFYVSDRKATWSESNKICQGDRDALVKIANAKMNIDAQRLAKKCELGCWIGLRKREELCWGNGEEAVLVKSSGSCEDTAAGGCNCVTMATGGTWIEVPCDEKQAFVCEKDADKCRDPSNECHKDAVCINTVGSYHCRCKTGFLGNGKICVEPNNFEMSMMNVTNKNEVEIVIKSCASELKHGGEAEPVLRMLENITLSFGEHLKNAAHNGTAEFILKEENIILGVVVVKKNEFHDFTFPDDVHSLKNSDEKIVFPVSLIPSGNNDSVVVVGMVYDTPNEISSVVENQWFINSKTVAGIVHPKLNISRQNPVKIVLKKLERVPNEQVQCVFWEFKKGMKGTWSTKGCHVSNSNDSHVTCECSHLTNFAILMRVGTDKAQVTEKDSIVLNIITFVGLSASIIGCFLTLLIHLCFRKLRRDRGFIHINLVLALAMADIIFMISILSDAVDAFCTAVALLIFYFFLALFFWMFVEGLHIYFMVTKVFDTNAKKVRYYYGIIGWVLPLVIVGVTYGSLRSDVLSNDYCWLSISSGAIWAFVGPVILIMLINIFIIILVLKITLTIFSDDPESGRIKSAFRTFLMLAPILGTTWVFGLLTIAEYSIVFQYLFAIFNSFQGLIIFVLYCLFNKEARKALKRKMDIIRSSRDITYASRKSMSESKLSFGTSAKNDFGNSSIPGRYTPRGDRSDIVGDVFYEANGAGIVNNGWQNEKPSPEIYPLDKIPKT